MEIILLTGTSDIYRLAINEMVLFLAMLGVNVNSRWNIFFLTGDKFTAWVLYKKNSIHES